VGQKSANDNNKNIKYKKLDSSIENSYVKDSLAGNQKSLYDSYIRAIKWSSNRLAKEESGIVAFIVNNSFIKSNGMDGLRKHLAIDYDKIYMLDLKGNSRNLGEDKLEGGNIFDIRTGVAIIILVKGGKQNKAREKQILYANIGDGLKKEEKFERLKNLKGISGIKGYLEDGALNGNILPLEGNNAVEYGGGYFLNK
jgi:predicted helicase